MEDSTDSDELLNVRKSHSQHVLLLVLFKIVLVFPQGVSLFSEDFPFECSVSVFVICELEK